MSTEGYGLTNDLKTQLSRQFKEERAADIAEEIAKRDTDTLQLVGLTTRCENAVYWEAGMYEVIRVSIKPTGLVGLAWWHISTIEDEEELEAWLDGVGEVYFAWISPAYR